MLYDETFLASLPLPQPQERHPLINLKILNPRILDILNIWFNDLLPEGNQDLFERLRDFRDSRNFIGAFWELVVFRYLRETGHNVLYNVDVNGKTPDFYWPEHNLIGDVVAISDPHHDDAARAHLDTLATMINGEDLPFDLTISEFWFSKTTNPRFTPILQWLRGLDNMRNEELYEEAQEYEVAEAKIEVLIRPRTTGARVKSVGMFSLDSDQLKKAIKGRLRQKVKTYQRPLVVFVGEGLGFWTPDGDTMNMVLYGDWLVHFSRVPGQQATGPATAANGFFYNRMKPGGLPANTQLSAVVLAKNLQATDRLSVWMGAFHNPEAVPPLPHSFFKLMAQFLITSDHGTECTLGWVDENDGILLGDPLP